MEIFQTIFFIFIAIVIAIFIIVLIYFFIHYPYGSAEAIEYFKKDKLNVEVGDKVILKGKFCYPYDNLRCDNCIGIIKNVNIQNVWELNDPIITYDIDIIDTRVGNITVKIRKKNIHHIIKKKNKRVFSEIDPYGEENWED